jgi:hypothetical protein
MHKQLIDSDVCVCVDILITLKINSLFILEKTSTIRYIAGIVIRPNEILILLNQIIVIFLVVYFSY